LEEYSPHQQNDAHFAKAFEQICKRMEDGNDGDSYFIASPYNEVLFKHLKRIKKARKVLRINGMFIMGSNYIKTLEYNKDCLWKFKG
jgi:hypothetical protein